MSNITCLSPVVILNPRYIELVLRSEFIFNGDRSVVYYINPQHRCQLLDGSKTFFQLFPSLCKCTDKLSWLFVQSDMVCDNVYLEVPCGKCAACQSKRYYSIVQRMQFEGESCLYDPLFVTLTYNDKYLPFDGVSVRHIQLFKKRLSKHYYKLYHEHLRYACFSEYGEKSQRPHYHLIIYNYFDDYTKSAYHRIFDLSQLIMYCWRDNSSYLSFDDYKNLNYRVFNSRSEDPFSFGFINVSRCQSSQALSYVSKYVNKGSNVPPNKNKNFALLSKNMGVDFVLSKKQFILDHPRHLFVYKPKNSNSTLELHLSGYYINKLFPSFCSLVNSTFRSNMYSFIFMATNFIRNRNISKFYKHGVYQLLLNVRNKFPLLSDICDFADGFISSYKFAKSFNANAIYNDYGFTYNIDDTLDHILVLYNFFEKIPDDYENTVFLKLYERDKFLSSFSDSQSDPLLKSVRYRSQISSLISKSKIY